MVYKLRCGMEIKSQAAIEQLDRINLKKGNAYSIYLKNLKRSLKVYVVSRFGQTVVLKVLNRKRRGNNAKGRR